MIYQVQPSNNDPIEAGEFEDIFLDQMLAPAPSLSKFADTCHKPTRMATQSDVVGSLDLSQNYFNAKVSRNCDDYLYDCGFQSEDSEDFACNNSSLSSVDMRLDDESIIQFKCSKKPSIDGLDEACLALAPTRHNSGLSALDDLCIDDL